HAWKAKTKLFWRTDGQHSSPARTDFKVETRLQPVDVTMRKAESNHVAFRKKQTTRKISICLVSGLLLVPLLSTLRTQAQQTAGGFDVTVPSVPYFCLDCGGSFTVHSYQGRSRCLDYTPETTGSPIFINDCQLAHPIVVQELADGKHTVI